VPFCIQGRAVDRERLGRLSTAMGLASEADVPLMVLEDDARVTQSAAFPELAIRELSLDEYDLHTAVAAAGFEAPVEVFQRLTAIMRGVVDVRVYLASVGDTDVSTAVGVRSSDGAVGVFNVATPPEHRRHGYGAAVTARVAADAMAAGARWVWLQSSEQGLAVYERLGFRIVETWPCWVTT
jgi:predicted GNAT family acetyltransferase